MTDSTPKPGSDTPLAAAVRETLHAAWALCDGTEGTVQTDEDGEHFRVPRAEWEALSKALDGIDELIPEADQPAQPSYAVTLLTAPLKACATCGGFGLARGGVCWACGGSGRERPKETS